MRKSEKIKMLAFLDTLDEANKEIKKFLKNTDTSKAVGLLAECQDFADALYDFYVKANGGDESFKRLILDYLAYIQTAAEQITDGSFNRKKTVNVLNNHVRILNKFISDISTKKVVVFMPYKAAMWDSLESIWAAAKDDEDCESYVIPVPYFDRLPNGSFDRMYYEGSLFPDYVPITHYQQFDLSEMLPDIIYVHNPYDAQNLVTTVHPGYYSGELKKHTGLLVYSPYFVVGGTIDENMLRLDSFANFDCILAQSEEIRQQYIKCIKSIARKYPTAHGYASNIEKRVLGLGSPKFDKILNSRREEYVIPPEWDGKIAGKKVILYNTTLSALLYYDEKYIKKVKSVLETAKARDDVILWWRPHPLILSTLKSMRPHIAVQWKEIVEEYLRDGFGIYDDTSDLNRAIAWSDAYYGDTWGSLVVLYRATGNPIMLSDNEKDGSYGCFPAFVFSFLEHEHMYFSEETFNMFCKININTKELTYMGEFPGEQGYALYRMSVKAGGKLYFSPFSAKKVAVYDLVENKFCPGIEIKSEKYMKKLDKFHYAENGWGYSAFIGAIAYKNYIFFTPYKFPAIARLDIATNEVEYYDDFVDELLKLVTADDAMFTYPVLSGESTFLCASANSNTVLEFNMETNRYVLHGVGNRDYCYGGICFDGENYWLTPRNIDTPIVKWHPRRGLLNKIENYYLNDIDKKGVPFHTCLYAGGFVWLFQSLGNPNIKIDVSCDSVEIASDFERIYSENMPSKDCFRLCGDSIMFYQNSGRKLVEYDFLTGESRENKLLLSDRMFDPEINIVANPLYENKIFSLNEYFGMIAERYNLLKNCFAASPELSDDSTGKLRDNQFDSRAAVGAKIYDYCKSWSQK